MIDIPSIPIYSSSTGSFGTSRDLPSLDLAFALDKTLTARRGPTPVFSRGTSATLVNESGLIQYAPENLFLNNGGAFRTSALATKYSSNELDPDGGSSCLMVVETNVASQARTELPSSFADAYTRRRVFSWWVKPSPGVTLPAYLHLVYKDNARVSFSTATWSVATQTDGATGSIVESNGWYKLIAYLPGEAPSSTTHKLVFTDTDYYGGPLTAIRGLLVGSSQLSSGTFAWPHFQTLTNPYYAPRFDHDPVTLACKGLLIEELRTNLSLQSGVIVNNSGWSAINVTAVVSGTGPDGNNSYRISETATSTAHALANFGGTGAVSATSVVSGTSYTGSIFVKKVAGSVDFVQLTFGFTGFGVGQFANFNISNGTVGNYTGLTAGTVPCIEEFPNGWYRISMTATATATVANTSNVILTLIDNMDSLTRLPSYLGNTSNEVLTSLCQFEAGSFPTSYIPTTTTALTRSADVCSITGANFTSFYNQSEGTLFTSGVAKGALVMASSGINSDQVAIVLVPSIQRLRFDIANAGVYTAQVESGIISEGSFNKIAGSYSANDARSAFNGTLGTPDTSVTVPTNLTTLHIGKTASVSLTLNGTVARIQYFRKRLPNAKLQSLTTP